MRWKPGLGIETESVSKHNVRFVPEHFWKRERKLKKRSGTLLETGTLFKNAFRNAKILFISLAQYATVNMIKSKNVYD